MTELEQQLAAYTGFLEERSLARAADHTTPTEQEQGDVIVVDLMERRETEDEANEPAARRAGWRTPIAFLAAAALALVVAVVALLNTGDEGANDVVTTPDGDPAVVEEAPTEPDATVDAETPLAGAIGEPTEVGVLLQSAITTGDPALVSLYADSVRLSVDGAVAAGAFESLTTADVWTAGYATPAYEECIVGPDERVTCPVIWRFDGTDLDLVEDQVFTIEDGRIVAQENTRFGTVDLADGLSAYRFWLAVQGATSTFSADGAIGLDTGFADAHRADLQTFFADPGGQLASALTQLWQNGTLTDKERIVDPAVTGTVDGFDFTENAYWLLTNVDSRDLIPPTFESCTVNGPTLSCTVSSSFAAFGSDAGGVSEIGWVLADDRIVELTQVNPNSDEVTAGYADYRAWVQATHPDEFSGLFLEGGLLTPFPDAMARHAQLAPEYLASIG
ncbi:MAG: hypothetical protein AAF081_04780 [Actinomycetota bacterium]